MSSPADYVFADTLLSMMPPQFEAPTGTVVSKTATTMQVLVRGVTITAGYLDLGVSTPGVGDLVVLGRQASSWYVQGRLAGVGANAVANFSFEQDGARPGVPSSWFLSQIAGAGTVATVATGYAPAGTYEAVVTASGGVTQDSLLYSSPINVAPGQVWALSAFAAGVYPPSAALTATARLFGLWFANDTSLYPTTSAADTLVQNVTLSSGAPGHFSLSGSVTVPAATTFMRVGLRSGSAANVSVAWDAVIARRTA